MLSRQRLPLFTFFGGEFLFLFLKYLLFSFSTSTLGTKKKKRKNIKIWVNVNEWAMARKTSQSVLTLDQDEPPAAILHRACRWMKNELYYRCTCMYMYIHPPRFCSSIDFLFATMWCRCSDDFLGGFFYILLFEAPSEGRYTSHDSLLPEELRRHLQDS